tara:strand:- start:303 stop:485 length:183 start_codon:yes stop_codon:yes gene_type:complete
MSGSYSLFAQERINVRQNAKLPAGIENLKLDTPLSMQAKLENLLILNCLTQMEDKKSLCD